MTVIELSSLIGHTPLTPTKYQTKPVIKYSLFFTQSGKQFWTMLAHMMLVDIGGMYIPPTNCVPKWNYFDENRRWHQFFWE